MIVVSDTTAISNLFQVGLASILKELYGKIIISPGVHRELSRVKEQCDFLNAHSDWIIVKSPKDQVFIAKLLDDMDLGESESIALAIELNADYLIIDEKQGRRFAEQYGVKITGILGVLINAKKAGLIKNVGEHIDRLQMIGLWLSPRLVEKVLRSLGET